MIIENVLFFNCYQKVVDNEKTDSQELCLTSHFGELEIKDPRGALQIVTYIMYELYYTLRTLHYMIS